MVFRPALPRHAGDRLLAHMRVNGALDELQATIRRELDADAISLDAAIATAATGGNPSSSGVPHRAAADHDGVARCP